MTDQLAKRIHTERLAIRMINKGIPHISIEKILKKNIIFFKDFFTQRYNTCLIFKK